jgi:RIO kinase 1
MSADNSVVDGLVDVFDAGLIDEVLFEVKSGKEATVYCCRAREAAGGLVAAKVYRDLATRRFRNSAIYQAGRVHLAREGRAKRAAENRTAFGLKIEQAIWMDHEWCMLHRLFDAGLDVPQPLARGERAILMPFLGDERKPSPMLYAVEIQREDASAVVDRLLWNVRQMLDLHVVHGDLSPFNVMWHDEKAVIIDLPQAVDPRLNPAAQSLLRRDIGNLCEWASRFGVRRDAATITADLWMRFQLGEIG